MYQSKAVRPPQLDELKDISDKLRLSCSQEELTEFKAYMEGMGEVYTNLNRMVAPTLPVKYPRTTGYRPKPDENKFNAWYWRCDISGAADGILRGKTVAVKDNICVAGVPMMNGSTILEGYIPDIDATVITKVLDAGCRVVGKANCESMCFSASSWSNDTGPTLNPHDPTRTSGGSSSGCAVAVCNGDVDVAIGADQGGSIRIPSSWCGIVGMKPTWGLVPYTGALHMEPSCDHIGPMARNVMDCALLLEAMAGFDGGKDPRQSPGLKVPEYSKLMSRDLSGIKVGMVTEGFANCTEDIKTHVREAAMSLKRAGALVEEVSVPLHADAKAIFLPIFMEGVYRCMIQGSGAGYHYKGYYPSSMMEALRKGYATKSQNMSETLKLKYMFAHYIYENYGNKFYGKAQNMVIDLTKAYDTALENYDVIIMPTLPYKAPLLPKTTSTITERVQNALGMLQNTAPFDVTGHPSLTINVGLSDGLPVGMMINGRHLEDATVLKVAYAFEQLRNEK